MHFQWRNNAWTHLQMIKADTERPFVIIYGWEVKEAFLNSFAIENKRDYSYVQVKSRFVRYLWTRQPYQFSSSY